MWAVCALSKRPRARLDAAVQAVAAKRGVETSRQVAGVLRQGFGLALRLGAVSVNPALGIEVKTATAEPVRAMTADEVQARCKASRDFEAMPTRSTRPWRREIAAAIDVMLGTGVRIGELAGLRWADVDLSSVPATMTVSAIVTLDEVGVSRQERTKTASSERVLYLPRFATEALRKHRKKALDDSDDSPRLPERGWRVVGHVRDPPAVPGGAEVSRAGLGEPEDDPKDRRDRRLQLRQLGRCVPAAWTLRGRGHFEALRSAVESRPGRGRRRA